MYKSQRSSQMALVVKNLPASTGDRRDVQSIGQNVLYAHIFLNWL